MKIIYAGIFLVVVLGGCFYCYQYFKKEPISDVIELEKDFSLIDGKARYYENVAFTFSSTTLPMTRNSTTGIEQYPTTQYKVKLNYTGVLSTVDKKGNKVEPVTEDELNFSKEGDSRQFLINFNPYILEVRSIKDNMVIFRLHKVTQ